MATWEQMFSTNFFGPVRLTRALLPAMRAAGRGRIVLVSSMGAVRGMPGIGAYSAAKGALERWGESLSYEIAPFGLGVTVLVTGTFKTDILELTQTWADPDGPYGAAPRTTSRPTGAGSCASPGRPSSSPPAVERGARRAPALRPPRRRHRRPPAPGRQPAPTRRGCSSAITGRALGIPRPGSLRGDDRSISSHRTDPRRDEPVADTHAYRIPHAHRRQARRRRGRHVRQRQPGHRGGARRGRRRVGRRHAPRHRRARAAPSTRPTGRPTARSASSASCSCRTALEAEQEELREELILEVGCPRMVTHGPQLDLPARRGPHATRPSSSTSTRGRPTSATPWSSLTGPMTTRKVWREPVGVVGAIVPWNYPFEVTINKLGQALATGNTVVLKPAPDTPFNATRIGRLVAEHTDIPAGVAQRRHRRPTTSSARSSRSRPRSTSSPSPARPSVGKRIMEKGAATMKRLFLELGGKSATIVLDDADLGGGQHDRPSACACTPARAAPRRPGCCCPGRATTRASSSSRASSRAVTVGDPQRRETLCGPVISAKQRDRVVGYIEKGIDEGANLARRRAARRPRASTRAGSSRRRCSSTSTTR